MSKPRQVRRSISAIGSLAAAFVLAQGLSPAIAAPGDLLATVTLPGNGSSVSGATIPGGPSGVVYIAPRAFFTSTWDIYDPPAGFGPQVAALLATKTFVDAANNPVAVSCGTWDPTRDVLWVATAGIPGPVYSVDLGDLTVSGNALATFEFNSNVGGISLCDGIAYDPERDTLWISPDVNQSVYEYDLGGSFTGFGTQIRAVSPQNAAGQADGLVSGVTVGTNNTLYIGRNGAQEVRRVDKDTGAFISQFAQTVGRAEDLSCDPVTYAPLEAILAKEAYTGLYEAFEVETDTCPLPGLLDLFKCYVAKNDPREPGAGFTGVTVGLTDRFASTEAWVARLHGLCNPADKSTEGEPVEAPLGGAHLSCYQIDEAGFAGVTVDIETENFGPQTLRLTKGVELCAPAEKTFDGETQGSSTRGEDFKCYAPISLAGGPPLNQPVSLADQFGTTTDASIVTTARFCTEVTKNGTEAPANPNHLVCYKTSGGVRTNPDDPSFPLFGVVVSDQFQQGAPLEVAAESSFCEEAELIAVDGVPVDP